MTGFRLIFTNLLKRAQKRGCIIGFQNLANGPVSCADLHGPLQLFHVLIPTPIREIIAWRSKQRISQYFAQFRVINFFKGNPCLADMMKPSPKTIIPMNKQFIKVISFFDFIAMLFKVNNFGSRICGPTMQVFTWERFAFVSVIFFKKRPCFFPFLICKINIMPNFGGIGKIVKAFFLNITMRPSVMPA